MSTRAVYTFEGFGMAPRHVYVHHDGYPTGAAQKFAAILESGLAWPLPRYEPDEMAAAFIAANKTGPGSVRIATSRTWACDVEFGYTIRPDRNPLGVSIRAVSTNYWDGKRNEQKIYDGPLSEFIAKAEQIQAAYDYS